jgi:hypothetical protein
LSLHSGAMSLKEKLASRVPKLESALAQRQWRAQNSDRALDEAKPSDPALARLLADVRRDGIAFGRFEELFGSKELFEQAAAEARRLKDAHAAASGGDPGEDERKPFIARLLSSKLDAGSPFAKIALDPRLLEVANGYMGMRSLLWAADVWWTFPTPGPAVETQLWHRDGDDLMNLKLFVYFKDVNRDAGPFCYAPGTHPLGTSRRLPERDAGARSTDEQMAAVVPPEDWIVATGEAGTVILADTCGYHKQVKPEGDDRLLYMVQYTSGTPQYPRKLEVSGVDESALDIDQRFALYEQPAAGSA